MDIFTHPFIKRILLLSVLSLGFVGVSLNLQVLADQDRAVLGEIAATQQVYPLLTPATVSCDHYWQAIPTVNGLPAFLTLNVNNPDNSYNSAEWRPTIPLPGSYRVEAYIPAPPSSISCSKLSSGTQNTSQAKYQVHHASGVSEVTLNQNANLNKWVSLGTYQLAAGDTNFIKLTDLNSESNLTRFIVFSAIRFIPQDKEFILYFPMASRQIPPPVVENSSVVIRQRQAFDTCIRPTLSRMQTWWNSSPYYIYNIYMGGISNSSCHPETLTASWIASVHAQGWEFIPTWVGPQAPCTSFNHRFSYDPEDAFGEGVYEANLAYNRAVTLGLVGAKKPKTIIYYDMEAFYGGSTECRTATKNFLSGWSQRLHELGARSAVYGSSCYYMPDWQALSNPLDDAWLASWYKVDHDNNDDTEKVYFYDPYANVTNVLCSASIKNSWTNHQRIRQYSGGHNETWGGVTVNIDGNITDGHVFSPSGALAADTLMEQPITAFLTEPGQIISQFQPVAPLSGWLFQNGRLLWTLDGGVTWEERTPVIESEGLIESEFISFHFQDTQTGWSILRSFDENQIPTLQVLRTSNGGVSWLSGGLPVSPELASQVEKGYFDFIDSSTGWLSMELRSSSVFKPGILFLTRDGGDTWQDLPIPIGEPVNFITSLVGWTAGGPAGDEFYVTRNGGLSWESAAFIMDGTGMVNYSLPEFSDPQTGTLLVTVIEESETRLEQFTTQDGGLTWQLVGLVPITSEITPGATVPVDVIGGDTIVAADAGLNFLYSSKDSEEQPLSLSSARLPEGVVEIEFITPLEGWAKAVLSFCTGEKSINQESSFSCTFNEALWKTVDGGLTWQQIR